MSSRPCVVLIGSEYEENLSLRYLAAALERAGFRAHLVPFDTDDGASAAVNEARQRDPLLVGISVPFQLRAGALLGLGALLRSAGFAGHVTTGGHFVTFEWSRVLADHPAIDSVVRHEGEEALVELCESLRDGRSPVGVPGVVARDPRGRPVDGGLRRLPPLDALAFPDRRGAPHTVMGVPVAPIVGSRGCYADCSFCCIYAYAESADAARYRMRSPENVVEEMVQERERRGVRLFVFHDDNFFVPSEEKNLARYRRMRQLLLEAGLDDIALVIKCRPNDVTEELFRLLRSMGMIRAYVGIETNSDEGVVSLNRRISAEDNRRALRILRELEVYCSFNVLLFDPEATLEGVRRNLDFMDDFAHVPFNFCRAEVYAGTPLKSILENQGRLRGSYTAWGYEMRDPRVELLFRITMTAFHSRNFKSDGVHNLNLGLRFDNEVMRWFHTGCWDPAWQKRLTDLSRRIGRDSVALVRRARGFAAECDLADNGAVKDFTVDLARRIARADLSFIAEMKACRREMERRIASRCGVSAARTDYQRGLPVWAAESRRLASSTGREPSGEALPAPGRPA